MPLQSQSPCLRHEILGNCDILAGFLAIPRFLNTSEWVLSARRVTCKL